jgi:O-antigen ligase
VDGKLQDIRSISKFGLGLIAATITITISVLFGGAPASLSGGQVAVIIIALASGFGLLSRRGMQDLDLPWQVVAVFILIAALPLFQLIPLPPEIWRSLPGRDAEKAIIDLAGGGNDPRPMALNPIVNLQLFASIIALFAFTLTVARLSSTNIVRLLRIMLSLAFLQLVIGGVQLATAGGALDFFGNSHKGWLLGTFANRNHIALFFASCILVTAALFEAPQSKHSVSSNKQGILLAIMLIWLLAAVGTGSRTGFTLALIAMSLAAAIVLRGTKLPVWAWITGTTIGLAGIAAVLSSKRVQQLVERYDAVGDDQRWSIWTNTMPVIADYMPWGSGFGSFVAVYNKSEPLDVLMPTYVNNAHSDYLELLVEAGLPGALILTALIVMVILLTIRGARMTNQQTSRYCLVGGGIVFLFACHSLVDYPIRRFATATLLFFAIGLLLRQFNHNDDVTV